MHNTWTNERNKISISPCGWFQVQRNYPKRCPSSVVGRGRNEVSSIIPASFYFYQAGISLSMKSASDFCVWQTRESFELISRERDSPDIYNSRSQREMQSYFSEKRRHASVQNNCRAFYPIDVLYACTSNARYSAADLRKQRAATPEIL